MPASSAPSSSSSFVATVRDARGHRTNAEANPAATTTGQSEDRATNPQKPTDVKLYQIASGVCEVADPCAAAKTIRPAQGNAAPMPKSQPGPKVSGLRAARLSRTPTAAK